MCENERLTLGLAGRALHAVLDVRKAPGSRAVQDTANATVLRKGERVGLSIAR